MADWQEETGHVRINQRVDRDVYRLTLYAPGVTQDAHPGQFVMVSGWDSDPLLPRAMAPIRFNADDGTMDIYYRVVGPGTQAMSTFRPGDAVTVIGPLGTPLAVSEGPVALIGRGVGITPLLPIAEQAATEGLPVRTYLSARTYRLVVEQSRFLSLGPVECQVDEDAPASLVTSALQRHLEEGFRPRLVVVAGAHRLARAAQALSEIYRFRLLVFVEEKMACGVGFCKGCTVGQHNTLICMAGPALPALEVL